MQMRFANRDEFAWDQGEKAFEPGDTLATGVAKAAQAGFRAGCNGYSAYITAFCRRIRQYQESNRGEPEPPGSKRSPVRPDDVQPVS